MSEQSAYAAGLPISAVSLPFLGSRLAPHGAFQYLPHELGVAGVTFAIPSWVVRREHFRVGDRVDFHFPFSSADGWHRQDGEVVEVRWDAENSEQVCRAEFRRRQPLHHPVFAVMEAGRISFRGEAGEVVDRTVLLSSVLRDCLLQKRGIAVYFKHLVPLLSRITLFPTEDFGALRAMVLEDVRRRITENIASLETWSGLADTGALTPENLSRELDLEKLRVAVEGEIENELFEATFSAPAIRQYTDAIRLLETKLFLNYNTLVLLYATAL